MISVKVFDTGTRIPWTPSRESLPFALGLTPRQNHAKMENTHSCGLARKGTARADGWPLFGNSAPEDALLLSGRSVSDPGVPGGSLSFELAPNEGLE